MIDGAGHFDMDTWIPMQPRRWSISSPSLENIWDKGDGFKNEIISSDKRRPPLDTTIVFRMLQ
ncbi:MAG TPA: hypothetical protein IAA58_06615 [Candidatus Gallacutalibacter stercoravium]|nr:hypothetical protein [Candidatus Gallacutalibacter stercoravium]